jgi:mRNA-degrading endonuclease RelE of RelBE toxin-antitoxin system
VTYKVVIDALADREIDDFGRYAADYSEDWAREQFARLNRVFAVDLAEAPNTWAHFYVTGAPYRGYLFRVGRRTGFWIIYTVDEDAKTVNVLRFWNASKELTSLET